MPRFDTAKARPMRKRPGVEALEARELLANLPLPAIPSGSNILTLPAVQYAFSQLYNPNNPSDDVIEGNGTVIASPQPSVTEVHREFFETIHASGIYGSSNQFLWGRPQLIVFPSTNPSIPATGTLTITASNYTQSGAFAILDLTEAALLPDGSPDTSLVYDKMGNLVSANGIYTSFGANPGEIVHLEARRGEQYALHRHVG
jgi:hypothetical protein